MTLEIDVEKRLGAFRIAARFCAGPGVTALFGRSGSGKTSLIQMIAGLERPDRGRIVVGGRVLFDHTERIDVPARRRRIGYVFQEGRLFPHLTVRQNLLYGRFFTPRGERFGALGTVVELLGIAALLDRRPAGLSGGEKQRVAIGRALLSSPRLLLMDEPLAALDEARKEEILPYVERLRDELGLPIVYVSHALDEVTRLASTLVLMAGGEVAAVGPIDELTSQLDLHPLLGRYEAGSVIEGRVRSVDEAYRLATVDFAGGHLRVPNLDLAPGSPVRVRIRARDVGLAIHPPEGMSFLNVLAGRVVDMRPIDAAEVEVRLQVGPTGIVARITRKAVDDLNITLGCTAQALVKSVTFDRHSLGRETSPPDGTP
ncbi:MAG TPA: molybdenum ABC transporter ATP-binding protein [Azospirillaceae bacterium]|nr:molybdenum ABC transporter ATP-binding protein [Azospirillaceae bacterium]